MAARELIDLFETMELDIIKGGRGKEENTQPYRIYENWLTEIQGYIKSIVSGKDPSLEIHANMNNFSRNDYEIPKERNNIKYNYSRTDRPYLEKKSREERLNDIKTKQTNKTEKGRGKGKWLV